MAAMHDIRPEKRSDDRHSPYYDYCQLAPPPQAVSSGVERPRPEDDSPEPKNGVAKGVGLGGAPPLKYDSPPRSLIKAQPALAVDYSPRRTDQQIAALPKSAPTRAARR